MFDFILPLGQTCNISVLMQNAKIKTHTTLFEWFNSPNLRDITEILKLIKDNKDDDIIKQKGTHVLIGENIYSGHYNLDEFKTIYKRRRDRLLNINAKLEEIKIMLITPRDRIRASFFN